MRDLQEGGPRCPVGPRDGCPPVEEIFREGGDRLASYMIRQHEVSVREGYAETLTYLSYIGYTESDTAFEYLRDRLRDRRSFPKKYNRNVIRALGHTADERVMDEAMRLFEEESTDADYRADALRALVRTMEKTGSRRPDAVEFLRSLADHERYGWYARKHLALLGIEGSYDPGATFGPGR